MHERADCTGLWSGRGQGAWRLLVGLALAGLTAGPGLAAAVEVRQLTSINTGGDSAPVWSRSGATVYYSSRSAGFPYVFFKPAGAPKEQQGTRLTQWFFDERAVTVSPDDAWVILEVRDSTTAHLYRCPALGGPPVIKLAAGPFEYLHPDWWGSAGDGWVAFATTRGGAGYQIWIMRPDGTDLAPVTDPGWEDLFPAFAPDGQSIAFASNRAGGTQIFVVERSGSGWTAPVPLTTGGDAKSNPSWSPDGRRLVYQSLSSRSGHHGPDATIWVMEADGSDPRLVTDGSGSFDGDPAWSPNGAEIAFASDRSGSTYIWIAGDLVTATVPTTWGGLKDRYGR